MAVEEEGLRVFQSVKIKIGERPGAGGEGGIFEGLAAASPSLRLALGDARSRSRPPSHLLRTVGLPAASLSLPPLEDWLGQAGPGGSGERSSPAFPASLAAPSPWRRIAGGGVACKEGEVRCRTQVPSPLGVCAFVPACVCMSVCINA